MVPKDIFEPYNIMQMKKYLTLLFCMVTAFSLSSQKPAATSDFTSEDAEIFDGVACDLERSFLVQPPNGITGVFSDFDCDFFCVTGVQVLAADFVSPMDGIVTDACWYGGYFVGNSGGPDDFTLTYYDDAGGLPGTIIGGPFSVTPTAMTTGNLIAGVNQYNYNTTHDPVPVTSGGTYYIEIVNNTAGNADTWFWETGDVDAASGGSNGIFFHFGDDLWALDPTFGDLAVSVGYGVEIVPTLGEWAVICLGLLMMIFGIVAVGQRQTRMA